MKLHHRFTTATATGIALALFGLAAQAQSTGPGATSPGPASPSPSPGIGYPTPTDPAARGTGAGSVTTPGASTSGSSSGSMDTTGTSGTSAPMGTSSGMDRSTMDTSSRRGAVGSAGTSAYGRDAYSLIPYTRRGYVGLNLGKTEFDLPCGSGGYGCANPEVSGYLYTGGMFNDWFGTELGYVNAGKADRAGGATRAQGVNLSLVARAPVGPMNLFAKAGALYGETRVSTGFLSDVQDGKERGWGAAYAVGVGFDFTPTSGVVLEWSRNEFRFPGIGRQNVDATSLGYVHRF